MNKLAQTKIFVTVSARRGVATTIRQGSQQTDVGFARLTCKAPTVATENSHQAQSPMNLQYQLVSLRVFPKDVVSTWRRSVVACWKRREPARKRIVSWVSAGHFTLQKRRGFAEVRGLFKDRVFLLGVDISTTASRGKSRVSACVKTGTRCHRCCGPVSVTLLCPTCVTGKLRVSYCRFGSQTSDISVGGARPIRA